MKKSKAKIKVIRKRDLKVVDAPPERTVEPGRKSARRMVSNVSTWVSELQRRKRAETKEALDKLFPVKPQTDCS
ncbi:MAG: hypothetical protein J5I65_06670 [Aridibacter famidurans]|nr:hypothetical protein [Aridibacter famidurans]